MLRSLLVRLKVLLTTMKNSLSLAFVLVLLGCTQIESKDWPEFRGPGGQGISTATGLPVHWSAKENVTWKKPIPGKAWSSPIILKGRIYMTTAVPTDDGDAGPQVLRVLALDGLELARDARRREGRRLEERTEAVQGAREIRRVDVEVVARVFGSRVGVRAPTSPLHVFGEGAFPRVLLVAHE